MSSISLPLTSTQSVTALPSPLKRSKSLKEFYKSPSIPPQISHITDDVLSIKDEEKYSGKPKWQIQISKLAKLASSAFNYDNKEMEDFYFDYFNEGDSIIYKANEVCQFKKDGERKREPIATVTLKKEMKIKKKQGIVYTLAVNPAYRRKGIAEDLMRRVIRDAKNAGLSRLKLYTNNPAVIKLYEKLGFSILKESSLRKPREKKMILNLQYRKRIMAK